MLKFKGTATKGIKGSIRKYLGAIVEYIYINIIHICICNIHILAIVEYVYIYRERLKVLSIVIYRRNIIQAI